MKTQIKLKNLTGRDQEIHYTDKTVVVNHGKTHVLNMKKIMKPELDRVLRVFHQLSQGKPTPETTSRESRQGSVQSAKNSNASDNITEESK